MVTSPDKLLSDAMSKMLKARIGRLPVVDPDDPTKLIIAEFKIIGFFGRTGKYLDSIGPLIV